MAGPLINRVAQSGIITLNLETYFPDRKIMVLDLKDHLFMEMILKEKDFRQTMKVHNWPDYEDAVLLIYCSTDAIIPVWAYMLVSSLAQPYAHEVYVGDKEAYLTHYYQNLIASLDVDEYTDKRIVIKGCSDKPVPAGAYQALTNRLKPHALSIMYGEPCSTVPIYKKPKKV
ncbi:MAG: DUF2480 family protein [Bacteroidota bacterium]